MSERLPSAFDWKYAAMAHRDHLPHVRQENVVYFITFRLADALPADRLMSCCASVQIGRAATRHPTHQNSNESFGRFGRRELRTCSMPATANVHLRTLGVGRSLSPQCVMMMERDIALGTSW